MKYIIDASNKRLGRVASEAARLLIGKDSPEYSPHLAVETEVFVRNASGLRIEAKKKKEKNYVRHSGYPGGLKRETLERALRKRGYGESVRRAVYGMLPKNKLRARRIKNLIVSE